MKKKADSLSFFKKHIKGKTAVFIDAANILYSQKTLGWKIDFLKLKKLFKKQTNLIGLFYFTGIVDKNQKQEGFLEKLRTYGYLVISKEVKFIKGEKNKTIAKGNLDVELALDAYRLRRKYKTLILFSGDSDFAYLINLLKKEGKKVIVFSTRGHISKELLIRAKYIDIRKLRKEIEFI